MYPCRINTVSSSANPGNTPASAVPVSYTHLDVYKRQFHVKEGPTVKVGKIAFDGNHQLSHRQLVEAMKNLQPIGIPHSIILEQIFPRTFDASKLDEDAERVRQAYRDKGYFKAITGEPQTNVRNAGGINPFTLHPSTGKRVDILIPVEEGERYRLGGITFTGNKAYSNVKACLLYTSRCV